MDPWDLSKDEIDELFKDKHMEAVEKLRMDAIQSERLMKIKIKEDARIEKERLITQRDANIHEFKSYGSTIREMAGWYGLSETTISKILKNKPTNI